MKKIFFILLLALSWPVFAEDRWTGEDKKQHFLVSAASGFAAQGVFDQKLPAWQIFTLGLAPGLLKELSDADRYGTGFSYRDMVWNAAGVAFGMYGGKVLITRDFLYFRHSF